MKVLESRRSRKSSSFNSTPPSAAYIRTLEFYTALLYCALRHGIRHVAPPSRGFSPVALECCVIGSAALLVGMSSPKATGVAIECVFCFRWGNDMIRTIRLSIVAAHE